MDDFPRLEKFLLVVGNGRSGSTLLGALLNAHPDVVVANETLASSEFWRRRSRADILGEISAKAEREGSEGRVWEGYDYSMGRGSSPAAPTVVGDKVWNPATLLLHGDHGLLPRLEESLGVPIYLLHVLRDPFDVVATMCRRSGASVRDRLRWTAMFWEAARALEERLPAERFRTVWLEDLVEDVDGVLGETCRWLGIPCGDDFRAACRAKVFSAPKRTRDDIRWEADDVEWMRERARAFPFLDRYRREWDGPPPSTRGAGTGLR